MDIVYTVYVAEDQSTHIFSTMEKAEKFAGAQPSSCLLSTYMIDNPERYYGATQ